MKLIKSAVIASSLAFTVGFFSTNAAAVCLGMACMYNHNTPLEGIDATLAKIAEISKDVLLRKSSGEAHSEKTSDEGLISDIKEALRLSKEINANDKVDRNRNRANDSLKKARTAVKDGDLAKASEFLTEADQRFKDLKSMLNLTQADRVSQQTNLLNRIMDTEDTSAGARSAAAQK
jgi:hypothetical protein